DGQSRMAVYPALWHSGRGYGGVLWESVCWDLDQALAVLARYRVRRKVDSSGDVSLYDQRYRVEPALAGEVVLVRFEAKSACWLFERAGQEVCRRKVRELTTEGICGLRLSRRPGRSAKQTQARRAASAAAASAGSETGGEAPGKTI